MAACLFPTALFWWWWAVLGWGWGKAAMFFRSTPLLPSMAVVVAVDGERAIKGEPTLSLHFPGKRIHHFGGIFFRQFQRKTRSTKNLHSEARKQNPKKDESGSSVPFPDTFSPFLPLPIGQEERQKRSFYCPVPPLPPTF